MKTQLVQHGRVERGRIGVSIQEVSQSLAQSFGLDRPRGTARRSSAPPSCRRSLRRWSRARKPDDAGKNGLAVRPSDAVNGKPVKTEEVG